MNRSDARSSQLLAPFVVTFFHFFSIVHCVQPQAMATSIAQTFRERIDRLGLGLGLEFNQRGGDAMLPASALRSAKPPSVVEKQQQHRGLQGSCVPGDSLSITSSLFPDVEGCYAILEMTENSTVYAGSDGNSFVLDIRRNQDDPSSEVRTYMRINIYIYIYIYIDADLYFFYDTYLY